MALTAWKGSVVRKQDIFIAKNYLTEDEIDTLNRLVVIFLETAELRAKNRYDITMKFWHENVDRILTWFIPNMQLCGMATGSFHHPSLDRHLGPI